MITDGKKWHYLVVRSLSALFRGITSSNNGDFYCSNFFFIHIVHLTNLKNMTVRNNHGYCHVDMLEEGKNILKYRPGDKSLKVSFIIYADLECILKKEQSCQNIPTNSYTEEKAKLSLSLTCSFDQVKTSTSFIEEKIVLKSFAKIF